jgi:hypothetical protein
MAEIPLRQLVFITHVEYFSVVLATPSDDGQRWSKYVKANFYIKLVALDRPCYSSMNFNINIF